MDVVDLIEQQAGAHHSAYAHILPARTTQFRQALRDFHSVVTLPQLAARVRADLCRSQHDI
jgi:hypothetical protein